MEHIKYADMHRLSSVYKQYQQVSSLCLIYTQNRRQTSLLPKRPINEYLKDFEIRTFRNNTTEHADNQLTESVESCVFRVYCGLKYGVSYAYDFCYQKISECVPVLSSIKVNSSSFCRHTNSQSGLMWHSQHPENCPDKI